jgi:hypothetical protein
MPLVPTVAPGQVISSSAWGNVVGPQTVMRFTTAAQRTSQLTAPVVGQLTQLDTAPAVIEYWTGSAWAPATAGAELAYAQVTAPVSVVNGVGAAQLIVETAARTYDGLPISIEFYSVNVLTPVAGAIHLTLYDGSTAVAELALLAAASGQFSAPCHARYRFTPTAGSHTYRVFSWVSSGTGTVNAGAGTASAFVPAFIRITRA